MSYRISEKIKFYLCVRVASPQTLTPLKDAYMVFPDPGGWLNSKANSLMYNNLYGRFKFSEYCRASRIQGPAQAQRRCSTHRHNGVLEILELYELYVLCDIIGKAARFIVEC